MYVCTKNHIFRNSIINFLKIVFKYENCFIADFGSFQKYEILSVYESISIIHFNST